MPSWMDLITMLEALSSATGRECGGKDAAKALTQRKITNPKQPLSLPSKPMRTYCLLLVLLVFSACTATRPYIAEDHRIAEGGAPAAAERVYQVFLIGDAGGQVVNQAVGVTVLRERIAGANANSAVVFVGDNIYCCGMPELDHPDREDAESRMLGQLEAVKDFPGRVVVIPGNHDWNDSRPDGLAYLRRQEQFVEEFLGQDDVFQPSDGFPGPTEIKLTDRIRLIAVDTEWWRYRHEKPFGDTGDYDVEEEGDFLIELDDLVTRRDDEDLLVVGHHPIFTNGSHGGHHTAREYFFPLTELHKALYVPLPLIGGLYPLFTSLYGSRQDVAHPVSKQLNNGMLKAFANHERLIYASGHDHNLQHFEVNNTSHPQHFIVSGAGARPHPVAKGKGAQFAASMHGLAEVSYYADGQVWLNMWGREGEETVLLYQTQLFGTASDLVDPVVPEAGTFPDYTDSTVVAAINPAYDEISAFRRFFWGDHNRWAWATPVEMQVLDLGRDKGGLTPIKRGGGQQTLSLRLEGGDGKEYALRTLDKDPSKTVPASLQGTVATDIVQDQIASIHPYGAYIIPPLAQAAGVNHTLPELVYVPDDSRLGVYRSQFANRVMMLEERPNDDESDAPNYGSPSEVISAGKLYREVNDDNDHRIDAKWFLRQRLFDMLLSDWDRHKGQWRWAAFEPYELDSTLTGEARTEGKIYRPIPRDRDWAFNKMNGVFPSLMPIFDPKFQDFSDDFGDLRGLTTNGMPQDRRFFSSLTREDWVAAAEELQERLTDEVIENAVRQWPAPIYERDGERVTRLLKLRRDLLVDAAEELYEIRAGVTDVVGSNKHERFEVHRLDDAHTEVVVYKTLKEGDIQRELYRRQFLNSETDEVRLYGLDGDDTFVVTGEVAQSLRVRAIGGGGDDTFIDDSRVRGSRKQTVFYDSESSTNTWNPGSETRTVRSDDPANNLYVPTGFVYDATMPQFFFGGNQDDGVFLGGGVKVVKQGFRKTPYAHAHRLVANIAAKTQAFNIVYGGHFVEALGKWDVGLDLQYLSPDNIRNFYGLGNETTSTVEDAQFYQARFTEANALVSMQRAVSGVATIRIGSGLQFVNVKEDEDRFIGQAPIQEGIAETTFDEQWFSHTEVGLDLVYVDSGLNPKQGYEWHSSAAVNVGLNSETYTTLGTSMAWYLSPSLSPQITLALRVGGAHNLGDFPFYGANTLGERNALRGYRSTRFAGRSSFYQNVELRTRLFKFSTYVAIGEFGLLGFLDNGRVWTDGEDSSMWHQGYGGGAWLSLFDAVVITGVLGLSDEDRAFSLRFGFLY